MNRYHILSHSLWWGQWEGGYNTARPEHQVMRDHYANSHMHSTLNIIIIIATAYTHAHACASQASANPNLILGSSGERRVINVLYAHQLFYGCGNCFHDTPRHV